MNYFTVCDPVTGQVLFTGSGGEPASLATEGELVLAPAPAGEAWWDGAQFQLVPPSTNPQYTWSWTTKTWGDPRTLEQAKAAKNEEINRGRLQANRSIFMFAGKQIACDELSRSDIDGVSSAVALTGTLPAWFPGAWKAVDNTFVPIPDVATWRAFVDAMGQQGAINFGYSQQLKAVLTNATTLAQVDAIYWGMPV